MSSDTDGSSSDSSSPGEEESLGSQIVKKLDKSVFDRSEFLPDGCIEKLITKCAVIKELGLTQEDMKNEKSSSAKLVEFILNEGRKLFAIMLMSRFKGGDLQKGMTQFRRNKLGDAFLPITEENESKVPFFNPPKKPWDRQSIRSFCIEQWAFLVPVFSDKSLNLQLHRNEILPFICQGDDVRSGAFGEVHQVTVHPSHHTNPVFMFDGERANVAIKEIKRVHTDDEAKLRELKSEWEREVKAHIDTNKFHHPNIIEFIAAVTRGNSKSYLLFRWADGGNLREFWQSNKKPQLSVSLVRDVVMQLRGLADALDKLHGYGGGQGSYRHGDIKPENILRVRTKSVAPSEIDVGILKIADMGLAKHHTIVTEFRPPTSMRYTTYRYEPPEVIPGVSGVSANSGRSRRQDIWSVGCVTLELIIWLLYGADALNEFNDKYIIGEMGEPSPYFEIEGKGNNKRATVHPAVDETMDALSRDQECRVGEKTALKDLLRIVKTKLLVVSLGAATIIDGEGSVSPPHPSTIPAGSRASARDLCLALDEIIDKGDKNERYWYSGKSRSYSQRLPRIRSQGSSSLSPETAFGQGFPTRQKEPMLPPSKDITIIVPPVTQVLKDEYRNATQIDKTEFPVDNKFAKELVGTIGIDGLFPINIKPIRLCGTCQKMEFFEPHFHIEDTWAQLESNLDICDFCKMRWEVTQHLNLKKSSPIRFDRDQSMLKLNAGHVPVMSICRSSELQTPNAHFIQVGLPKLPAAASKTHFDILRQFLRNCDANHPKCPPPKTAPLPTRLIDLGTHETPTILIYETKPTDSLQYIALSHPWGPGPHFCTFRNNLEEYKKHISFDKLPATFQHAVTTTRELGLRYLWIDSICIIQGPDGDFAQEAARMEDVFSSAYCMLAASSAKGQEDGFLTLRKENDFLTFDKGGQPLYICRFMDDFKTHVLEGPLNKRGWVLQERALAHRTIFFTDKQTYWECGEGVRCETLTKMDNQLISFLGDPNFPSKISRDNSDRGERIRLYENLYRQYSRLEFTRWHDRPIAIAGLEKRLIRDLEAQGGFGVFDDGRSLLQRSLLWRKGQEVSTLERIEFPPERTFLVPSWSWMGYEGAIDYLDLPLGGVDWPPDAILGPWAEGGAETWHTGDGKGVVALSAAARGFKMGKENEEDFGIFYDRAEPSKTEQKTLKCVVVGKRIMKSKTPTDETTHYVLLIAPKKTDSPRGGKIYERVGVGYMKGRFIDLVGSGASGLVNVQ